MAVNVVDFINKIQEEGLTTLKQTQEASLAAMGDFRKFGTELSEKPAPSRPSRTCRPDPARRAIVGFAASSSKSARPTRSRSPR